MTEQPGVHGASPDPHRCPDCRTVLVDRAGVATCPRCGFAGTDPQAAAIWALDVEAAGLISRRAEKVAEIQRIDGGIVRLGQSRAALIEAMRRERAGRAAPGAGQAGVPADGAGAAAAGDLAGGAVPAAGASARRRLSAQALLVGLGAFLLVAAGIVFAAVAWERLGAAGQASVLVGATALAATLTLLAARARLTATAEALSVVAAGFAVVDIHGFRLVVDPGGDAKMVWAVGLVVVTAGLVALARAGRARAPGVVAIVTAQPPLVLLGSLVPESGLGVATGLLVLALLDYALARRHARAPLRWLPSVAVALLRGFGSFAWAGAWYPAAFAAIGLATIGVDTPLRVWGLALMLLATAELAAVALAVARQGNAVRGEGYAAVLAGAAVLDVWGLRVLLTADGRGEIVWAVGLALVALGLVVLGRASRLTGPLMLAAVLAQAPIILLAAGADRYLPGFAGVAGRGVAVTTALVVVVLLDFLLARRLTRAPLAWIPGFVPRLLRVLGALAWVDASLRAAGSAFELAGGAFPSLYWWSVGVLLAASAEAALLARTPKPHRRLADVAAGASVLLSLVAVAAIAAGFTPPLERVLLVSTTAALAIALAPVLPPARGRPSADSRVRAGQGTAIVWAVAWQLPWVPTWIAGLVAPLAAVDNLGAWSREPSVTTEVARLAGLLGEQAGTVAFTRSAVAAVVLAVATVLISSRTKVFVPVDAAVRRWPAIAAGILGTHLALAMAAVGWVLPVLLVLGLYLLGAAALVWLAVRPGRALRPWFALAAAPFAAAALAWAGLVDQLTVSVLGVIAVLAGLLAARGLAELDGAVADGATAVAGAAFVTTGFTAGLLGGMAAPHALVLGLGLAAASSAFAWLADARAPWWTAVVEMTAAALALGSLAALALGGWVDPLSVGLGIVIVTAAAHSLRPTRRAGAGWTSAVVALVLLWLRLQLADVRVVEPYSLPAAGLLLVAGVQQLRRHPALGSWPALGPGLLVAAVPSVVVAVLGDEIARPLLVLAAAVGVTILGAQTRLRAPLVVGAVATVVVAFEQLFPVVAALPRWLTLGAAGVVLLVVGARFEHRRRQALHLYRAYGELR